LQITAYLPGILSQLGTDSLSQLKRLASSVSGLEKQNPEDGPAEDEDDVPDLVENFDEASKTEDVHV